MLLKGSPSHKPPAAMVVLLQKSVSHPCCSRGTADEEDVFTLHMPSSETVTLLGMRTLKYGGFGSLTKTKELFMHFEGSLAYEKGSLLMGETPWTKCLSLTHMVSHLV